MLENKTIIFTDDKQENPLSFNNILSFIKWALKEENQNIIIESKIKEIKKEEIENLYNFIKFYKQTKEICHNETTQYENKIENQNFEEIEEAVKEFTRVNKDGKYLRAILVGLGYQAAGKTDDKYKNLAAALELFQTSILINDFFF